MEHLSLSTTPPVSSRGNPKKIRQEEIENGSKKNSKSSKCRKRVGFAGLCLAVVMSAAVFSLLAPFYPDVASNNGLSDSVIGFVFAIFALMVMLVSPYLGVKMGEIGSNKMMIFGLALLSISTLLFSVLSSINPEHSSLFLIISIVLRVLQGIGAAGSETASYALAAQLYPEDLSYAVGVMETM
jgi:MFS family permease